MAAETSGSERAYRLRIAFCCFLMMFANQGLTSSSFNVYQSYLVQIPDVGDVGGSLILTVRALVSLIAMFFVGFYYRRISLRIGVFIATLFTAAAFIVYSLADGLGAFCLGAVLAGIGYGFGGMVAATALIGNWFQGRIGAASGIASMGTGVSSIVIPLSAGSLVFAFGLQTAFAAEAVLALAIGFVLIAAVRNSPAAAGFPEAAVSSQGQPQSAKREQRVVRPPIDLPKPLFRLMLVAIFLLGATTLSSFGYFSVLISTSGHGLMAAALATSVLGIVETCAKSAVGWIFDFLGVRRASLIFFGILVLGLLLCAVVGCGWQSGVPVAMVVYGVGIALPTAGVSIWALAFSTLRSQMATIRSFQIAYAFGGFAFNMLPGLVMQATGSYAPSYIVFAIFAAAAGLIILFVYGRFQSMARTRAEGGKAPQPQGIGADGIP